MGGIRYDKDRRSRGELRRRGAKEGGTSGILNSKSDRNDEQMALALAELGYRGDWVEVNTEPQTEF